jgi:hypothetical protein
MESKKNKIKIKCYVCGDSDWRDEDFLYFKGEPYCDYCYDDAMEELGILEEKLEEK